MSVINHKSANNNELRSEKIREMIAGDRDWVTRWAFTIITSIFSLLVVGALFIKYPSVVQEDATLTNVTSRGYIATIKIQQIDIRKLRTGQDVQLRINAYPYEKFGFIKGEIDYIDFKRVIVTIKLPRRPITSFFKEIQYHDGMTAHAIIIIQDKSLMEVLLK